MFPRPLRTPLPRSAMRQRITRIVPLLLLPLGACRDTSGSDPDLRGVVSFAYSGSSAGQFLADADARRARLDEDVAAAYPSEDLGEQGLVVLALDVGAAAAEDDDAMLMLALTARSPGDLPLVEFCEGSGCAAGTLLVRGPSSVPGEPYDFATYALVSGSVRITEVRRDRLRGTFSGTGRAVLGEAGQVTVQGGSFDVPILDVRPR